MDGSKVKEGDVISIEMANQQIDREINARRTQIISALGFTPAPQQLDCMTSLAYNSKGVSAFPKLITYLKSGDSRSAALQMLDMIYQKDTKSIPHPVKGLIYRRGSEFDMWMSGDYERLYHLPEHIRSLMIYMNSFNQEATELLLSMEKVK
jgi:GH24 family phage-related lysozyme (muramidase)